MKGIFEFITRKDMTKAIKITPTLTGQDAVNFFRKINFNRSKKVDKEILKSIKNDAEKLQAILKTQ